ncbi:DUF1206 domain-containing protein [Nocardioides jiangxiensis]|uniref:DUF1206 domain-containing protein n=1 Tax=Nocardioides jiangxiensis TaxID=3064524 RepID=A0ABT9AWQ0_9ACTN|nr:DUF1206 domain-containing protein [Nocardioides sp. WY-20]MDO7866892.1 DUF1206 domain-containing protein [Nocardioides sp. WY-20]
MSVKGEVEQAGRRADRSDLLDAGIRFGLVAYGLVHLVIAWLALQLALGQRQDRIDRRGAVHQLAEQPFGKAAVALVAAGMAVLVLWRVLELAVEHREEETGPRWWHRAVAAAKAVAYGAIGTSAFGVLLGSGGGASGRSEEGWSGRIMAWPGGPWLVAAVGAALLGYTVGMCWRGLTGRHREHLTAEGRSGDAGTLYVALGTVGYVAKGLAFGIVGGLFIWAAATHDPARAGGLDQALGRLLHEPAGPWLLGGVALGLACYGLFQVVRARHLAR